MCDIQIFFSYKFFAVDFFTSNISFEGLNHFYSFINIFCYQTVS